MALTVSQHQKMLELVTHVRAGAKRILLKGSAGTGKTYMTNEVIKVLKRGLYSYGAIYITAPTHKALAVLQSKIEMRDYLHFKTIHSALSLKQKRDPKTGKPYFVQEINPRFPPFRAAQAVILDEASMVDSKILKYIEDFPDILFIFVGDEKQLNPPEEDNSPVFHQGWPEVELTEIIRQGEGSPIIELSQNLGLIWKRQGKLTEKGHGYFYDNRRDMIIEKLAEVNGSDDLKYLAYTNIDVNKMNFDVRHKIYANPHRVENGESLIFTAPYLDYKNNQEIKVTNLEVKEAEIIVPNEHTVFNTDDSGNLFTEKIFKSGIEVQSSEKIKLKLYHVNGNVRILHEESDYQFKAILAKLKKDAITGAIKWTTYYTFLEQLASVNYNHAITVHKSQGSTYKRAVMNVKNINFNNNKVEKTRMFYTAVTRASEKVCLYNVR